MFFLLFSTSHQVGFPQAGGLKDISRWVSEAWRATPPVMNKKRMHPGGMPENHDIRFWHSFRMRLLPVIISGGVTRKASHNHRLISGKPPACFNATIQKREEY
jgi:hypothetical protein